MGKRRKAWKKKKKLKDRQKIIPIKEPEIINKFKKSNLADMLQSEYISLTDQITRLEGNAWVKKNYFIYWTMQNKKTIFETGNILLVDDDGSPEYFRQAFERKYKTSIPRTVKYNEIISDQVQKYRDMFCN